MCRVVGSPGVIREGHRHYEYGCVMVDIPEDDFHGNHTPRVTLFEQRPESNPVSILRERSFQTALMMLLSDPERVWPKDKLDFGHTLEGLLHESVPKPKLDRIFYALWHLEVLKYVQNGAAYKGHISMLWLEWYYAQRGLSLPKFIWDWFHSQKGK